VVYFYHKVNKETYHRETQRPMSENEITSNIIGTAIEIHKSLGPGLLESAYKECLYYKLFQSGFYIEKKSPCL
jgi:hypothetical protein